MRGLSLITAATNGVLITTPTLAFVGNSSPQQRQRQQQEDLDPPALAVSTLATADTTMVESTSSSSSNAYNANYFQHPRQYEETLPLSTSISASMNRMWATLRPHMESSPKPLSSISDKASSSTKSIESSVERMLQRLEPYTAINTNAVSCTPHHLHGTPSSTTSSSSSSAAAASLNAMPFFCSTTISKVENSPSPYLSASTSHAIRPSLNKIQRANHQPLVPSPPSTPPPKHQNSKGYNIMTDALPSLASLSLIGIMSMGLFQLLDNAGITLSPSDGSGGSIHTTMMENANQQATNLIGSIDTINNGDVSISSTSSSIAEAAATTTNAFLNGAAEAAEEAAKHVRSVATLVVGAFIGKETFGWNSNTAWSWNNGDGSNADDGSIGNNIFGAMASSPSPSSSVPYFMEPKICD